jgi:hypothetical protein
MKIILILGALAIGALTIKELKKLRDQNKK